MANTIDIVLPNGFICHESGEHITACTVKEVTGPEEDFLRTKSELNKPNVLARFLALDVVALGTRTDKAYIERAIVGTEKEPSVFSLPDTPTMMLAIRSMTEGLKYSKRIQCPACKTHQVKVVDLAQLIMEPAHPGDFDVKDIGGGLFRVKLLSDYGTMTFRRLFVSDLKSKSFIAKTFPKQIATHELCLQIDNIDGSEPNPASIGQWPSRIRNHMRESMDSIVAGVNVELDHECSNAECPQGGWTSPMAMDVSSFFFKTETGGGSRQKTDTAASKPSLDSGTTYASWLESGAGALMKSAPSVSESAATT